MSIHIYRKIEIIFEKIFCRPTYLIDKGHHEIFASVHELKPTISTLSADTWVWKDNLNGEYTTKSVYRWLLSRRHVIVSLKKWNWIWKLPLSASMEFFT